MSKKLTFNLIDIYTNINTFISQMILVVNEMLNEDYILPTEFGVYIFTPIWRRFKNSNACFENSEEGIASFKDNFTNQIQEIGFDFFSWCKANIEYFKTIVDDNNKNKSFSKQLNTGIYPVNENLQQSATQTQFATGTTNQNIVEIISNGIGWYKASQQFMTPQKKNDMLNSFKWLFIKYSNATKNEYTVLEIDKTGLIPVGDADYVEIVDDNLKSENIKTGVEILGIEGSAPLPKEEQSKSLSVTENQILNVYPDTGKVLNEVVVDVAVPPTPTEEKTININENGSTVVTPTTGSNLSKVTVNVDVKSGSNYQYVYLNNISFDLTTTLSLGNNTINSFQTAFNNAIVAIQNLGCTIEKISYYNGYGEVENGTNWSTLSINDYYSEIININGTLISIKSATNDVLATSGMRGHSGIFTMYRIKYPIGTSYNINISTGATGQDGELKFIIKLGSESTDYFGFGIGGY